MSKPIVAVTGASGHLGIHIVLKLVENGYPVRAMYHSQIPDVETTNVEWFKGDITNAESLEILLKNCQVVIHAAGLVQLQKSSRELVLETNVLGTQNILDHCLISNRKIRFIHISSTSAVSPFPRHEKMDENRAYIKSSELAYAWSKSMGEQMVLKSVEDHNMDAIILRPSAMIGAPDFRPSIVGSSILQFVRNQIPAITTGGYNYLDIRDAAQTIVNSIELGQKGEVYNLGGEFLTVSELSKVISEVSGCNDPKIVFPINLIILFRPILNYLYERRKIVSPFTRENLFFLKNGPRQLDCSKAEKNLKHKPRPIKESVEDLIRWFQEKKILT